MGRDKASVSLQGKTLLQRVLEPLQQVCSDVLVVTSVNKLAQHRQSALDVELIADLAPDRGPLGGLYSGLQAARADSVLLVGCDTPFLQPDLLRLVTQASLGKDAAVPHLDGIPQTLQAAYSRRCLPVIEGLLAQGHPGLRHLLPLVDVAYLERGEIMEVDPNLLSFFNVNSEADLKRAARWVEDATPSP